MEINKQTPTKKNRRNIFKNLVYIDEVYNQQGFEKKKK